MVKNLLLVLVIIALCKGVETDMNLSMDDSNAPSTDKPVLTLQGDVVQQLLSYSDELNDENSDLDSGDSGDGGDSDDDYHYINCGGPMLSIVCRGNICIVTDEENEWEIDMSELSGECADRFGMTVTCDEDGCVANKKAYEICPGPSDVVTYSLDKVTLTTIDAVTVIDPNLIDPECLSNAIIVECDIHNCSLQ